jgi:hypothetical protein
MSSMAVNAKFPSSAPQSNATRTVSTIVSLDLDYLSALPAELLFRILSFVLLDDRSLRACLMLSRPLYHFIKSYEEALIRHTARHNDPLAYRLLFRSHASFRVLYSLPHEEEIFEWFVRERAQQGLSSIWRCSFRDSTFLGSLASKLILRAGFLTYYGLVMTPQAHDKAAYIESLPLAQWALLNVFVLYLIDTINADRWQIFPRIFLSETRIITRVCHFISELTIFTGLKAPRDYIWLRTNPPDIRNGADVPGWARSFQSNYLKHGSSVLAENQETGRSRLALSTHMTWNMVSAFGPTICLGTQKLHCYDEYVFNDVLTALNVLPDGTGSVNTLLEVLQRSQNFPPKSLKHSKVRIVPYPVPTQQGVS